jgi:hypothetical protein
MYLPIVEQPVFALFDSEVFANSDHTINLAAMGRTVIEFGDVFAFEADIDICFFLDYSILNVFRTVSLLLKEPSRLCRFYASLRHLR